MFYNKISDLNLATTLLVITAGIVILLITYGITKIRLDYRNLFQIIVLSLFVNISTLAVVNNNYGGTIYRLNAGFPLIFSQSQQEILSSFNEPSYILILLNF